MHTELPSLCCRGLVVVGSPSTLYPDPTWRPWLDWVRQHQAIASAEAVYTYASTLPTSDSETDTVVSSSAVQTPKGSPGMASTDRVTAKKSVNEFRSLLSRSSGKAAP